ncbi:hypothetical protein F5Y14DRAFT_76468 [Nemania sp. NC0429]|nr:hypothetical protein F5Y14DRAFT_76468 [Nemania sp. NC0429]
MRQTVPRRHGSVWFGTGSIEAVLPRLAVVIHQMCPSAENVLRATRRTRCATAILGTVHRNIQKAPGKLNHTSYYSLLLQVLTTGKQDSASFIAITTKPDAAEQLLQNSPLERVLVYQGHDNDKAFLRSAWTANDDVSGPIATPVSLLPADSATTPTPASAEAGLSHKTFTLHIFPTNAAYDHREEVSKSPLHGQWPGDGEAETETYISAALRQVIPPGAMARALRDWETGNQLARDSDSFADDGPEGAASTLLGRKRISSLESFILERVRRRDAARETPRVMTGLFQFAEECRSRSTQSPSEPSRNTAAGDLHQAQADNPPLDTARATKPDMPFSNARLEKQPQE